ncbi:GGDEF domain-containing protein [Breoghania sp.]|uniref:GGDEF domain-containing protein n=1 Tax=Breoghania sp. TaxID=2065378 RepID=UPI002619BF5F|nr:GGDEF domain-containing protein [Breoghania sp.]MDJ0929922.1 GGDEF domain-containing protein [Breoghania sp.]
MGTFTWRAHKPGSQIWSTVIPLIALIATTLALAALFVARRIGRLSRRLEESERHNRHLASHDHLTGLANCHQFETALYKALAQLPDLLFAIFAFDLDRVKAVNDTYGHAAGDIVIRTVGERLSQIVGGNGLVARTGGDEFIALISGQVDRLRLSTLCGEAIAAMSAPISVNEEATTDVGASIGIAIARHADTEKTALLAAADHALYAAKSNGRGQSVFAEDLTEGIAPPEDMPQISRHQPRRLA